MGRFHFIDGVVKTGKYLAILEKLLLPIMENKMVQSAGVSDNIRYILYVNYTRMDSFVEKKSDFSTFQAAQICLLPIAVRLQNIGNNFTLGDCQVLVKTIKKIMAMLRNGDSWSILDNF